MSNFDDASYVKVVVNITLKEAIHSPYSDYQKLLFRKIFNLHERNNCTFKAIAEQLDREGYRSPKDKPLTAEIVFGLYKKGKMRVDRLSGKSTTELVSVDVF